MGTLTVIIGAILSALGIAWFDKGDNNSDNETRNNSFGRWEENQPYNP